MVHGSNHNTENIIIGGDPQNKNMDKPKPKHSQVHPLPNVRYVQALGKWLVQPSTRIHHRFFHIDQIYLFEN